MAVIVEPACLAITAGVRFERCSWPLGCLGARSEPTRPQVRALRQSSTNTIQIGCLSWFTPSVWPSVSGTDFTAGIQVEDGSQAFSVGVATKVVQEGTDNDYPNASARRSERIARRGEGKTSSGYYVMALSVGSVQVAQASQAAHFEVQPLLVPG
jgi:hypothetical protein